MIKAREWPGQAPVLLFDLGNILVRLNGVECLWPGVTPAASEQPFSERWAVSKSVADYETGRIRSLSEFYTAARQEMGFTVSEAEFETAFVSIIGELYSETIPLLRALRGHYPLMMLSNTNEAHWRRCGEDYGLAEYFDQIYLSCDLGVMKPDEAIYQQVLASIGYLPQNIWYFDDRKENIDAALKLGINGFVSNGGMQIINDLKRLNFII